MTMSSPSRRYSLTALAREVGISVKTLRNWRMKGWLRPDARTGVQDRYSLEAFERAAQKSVATDTWAHGDDDYDTDWTKK